MNVNKMHIKQYSINTGVFGLDGVAVTGITATAHVENKASQKILHHLGMRSDNSTHQKHESPKYQFSRMFSEKPLPEPKSPVSVLGLFNSTCIVGPSCKSTLILPSH